MKEQTGQLEVVHQLGQNALLMHNKSLRRDTLYKIIPCILNDPAWKLKRSADNYNFYLFLKWTSFKFGNHTTSIQFCTSKQTNQIKQGGICYNNKN